MHGCNGKMGQVITKIAEADSKVEIVAGVDQFQGVQNPYPVFSSMEACDAEADVVIDFSNAAAVDRTFGLLCEQTTSRSYFVPRDFLKHSLKK